MKPILSPLVAGFSILLGNFLPQVSAKDFRPAGIEIAINQETDDYQWRSDSVQIEDGNVVVVWAGDGGSPVFRIYTKNGTALTDEIDVDVTGPVSAESPTVAALPDGGFIIAWQKVILPLADYGYDVLARAFKSDGTFSTSVFRISESTLDHQVRPQVAVFPDGRILFVWEDDNDTYRQLRYRIYDEEFNAEGSDDSVVTNTQDEPYSSKVAILSDGTALVAWHRREGVVFVDQVRMRRIDSEVGVFGPTYLANENDNASESFQYNTSVCPLPDGGAICAWTSDPVFGSGDGYDSGEIKFQRFALNPDTNELELAGDLQQANTVSAGSQVEPCLETWNKGFIIGWTSENNERNQGDGDRATGEDGDGAGVFARSYFFDGSPAGMPFQINDTTADHQYQLSLASLGEEIWASWTSDEQDGSYGGVYSRRLIEYVAPDEISSTARLAVIGKSSGQFKYSSKSRKSKPKKLKFVVTNAGQAPLQVALSKTPKWLRANTGAVTLAPGQAHTVIFSIDIRKLPRGKSKKKENVSVQAVNGIGSTSFKIIAKGRR